MRTSTTRIRALIFAGCILILLAFFADGMLAQSYASLRIAALTQNFGLISILFLYISLLITPLTEILPPSVRAPLVAARRPFGVATALAAVLHGIVGFWGELGGFSGIPFLSHTYRVDLVEATIALLILLLLAATSLDVAISRLGGARWKWLHRLVYLAAVLIGIHTVAIGSDFIGGNAPTLRLAFVFVAFLLILEALRIDRALHKTYFKNVGFGTVSLVTTGFLVLGLVSFQSGTSLFAHNHGGTSTATSTVVHFHANFLMVINDQPVDFSAYKYMEPVSACSITTNQTPQDRVHMHSNDGGLVHVHSANVTWGDFFTNLGYSINPAAIVTDAATIFPVDATHQLTFYINGQKVTNIADEYIISDERLLIDYGSDSSSQIQAWQAKVPSNADYANTHTDPAVCGGH